MAVTGRASSDALPVLAPMVGPVHAAAPRTTAMMTSAARTMLM
jgi:hypothetical protein